MCLSSIESSGQDDARYSLRSHSSLQAFHPCVPTQNAVRTPIVAALSAYFRALVTLKTICHCLLSAGWTRHNARGEALADVQRTAYTIWHAPRLTHRGHDGPLTVEF